MTLTVAKSYRVELGRPHQKYLTSNGKEVPGASTISNLWPKGEHLIAWAAKEERLLALRCARDAFDSVLDTGTEGWSVPAFTDSIEKLMGKEKAHARILAKAASVGTIAHAMCEAYVNGGTFDASGLDASDVESASHGYERFREWWLDQDYRLVSSERQFVNERHGYGGTVDILARAKDGSIHLIDLKTSKAIYEGHQIQVGGGYRMGCEDALGIHVSKVKIVRIGKDAGEFNPANDVLDMSMERQAWAGRAFLACLALWKEMPH